MPISMATCSAAGSWRRWISPARSLPPRRAADRVATVAVNAFQFKQPVFVGDLLSFYTSITRTGTTSVTVSVEVYAERQRLDAEVVKVTEAVLTYVATDEARRSLRCPPFESCCMTQSSATPKPPATPRRLDPKDAQHALAEVRVPAPATFGRRPGPSPGTGRRQGPPGGRPGAPPA